ncbi:response regulator [Rugosimonospora africana]|uniref:DNA-binding response regulator n=1 Tax=Rugosimonospora africana TaxID=556532 RepID=A0A8J3VS31_9ACTN|nr:response regulator transcription factor [Rugosimonospora africana]GIH16840.1 DNA-binding response regulator [Rugosimonospora africana]
MRVLICDDHVVFAESLADLLTAAGLEVAAVATDPAGAVRVMSGEPLDICLLDVMFGHDSVLPRLGDLVRLARGTRIVLLTGRVDAELLATARRAGVHGVTDKGCLTQEVLGVLQRVHSGEKVFPSVAPVRGGRPVHVGQLEDAQRLATFLTPRERATLSALVGGDDTRALARTLGVTPTTARCHIQRVLKKMGAHSRLEAVTTAVRCGLISPETGDWLVPAGVSRERRGAGQGAG